MKKVVRSISFRRKRGKVRLVAYASSSRGTRIVDGVYEFVTRPLDEEQVNKAVVAGLKELLKNQPVESSSRVNKDGGGL